MGVLWLYYTHTADKGYTPHTDVTAWETYSFLQVCTKIQGGSVDIGRFPYKWFLGGLLEGNAVLREKYLTADFSHFLRITG